MSAPSISVEVSYAEPQRARVKTYRVPPTATVEDVLRLARADPEFAGVSIDAAAVGIYGRVVAPTQAVEEGDRLEIYRPLAADPKSARRERVKQARKRRL